MRKTLTAAVCGAAAAAALALAPGTTAVADEHEPPAIPPHPHLLVIGAEVGFSPEGEPRLLDYRQCIDVAANRKLPLNAHHEHVHFGRAGEALSSAGHQFIPAAPAFDLPWTDCASFLEIQGF